MSAPAPTASWSAGADIPPLPSPRGPPSGPSASTPTSTPPTTSAYDRFTPPNLGSSLHFSQLSGMSNLDDQGAHILLQTVERTESQDSASTSEQD